MPPPVVDTETSTVSLPSVNTRAFGALLEPTVFATRFGGLLGKDLVEDALALRSESIEANPHSRGDAHATGIVLARPDNGAVTFMSGSVTLDCMKPTPERAAAKAGA